eukprot:CAMPEP_0179096060 /NCGR_PEP_ID=MMETSP0796-20121207/44138_1 /TAXON_ID=73915 /ORGANISM="Pyrodinium bahamense, Strain pbaha01" /LENGTH=99 /DNA_ID=CAMNT_0020793765 /DNA_START=173 /DNA_END=468 /DNA_ORIENTATION=-
MPHLLLCCRCRTSSSSDGAAGHQSMCCNIPRARFFEDQPCDDIGAAGCTQCITCASAAALTLLWWFIGELGCDGYDALNITGESWAVQHARLAPRYAMA